MSKNVSKAALPQATAGESPQADELFRLVVEGVQDYAIFLLSPEGKVLTWNVGAERIKGYAASEIIGQHFSQFYSREAKESGWPERELEIAASLGRFADEGWRVKKDGTTFWASVVITAMREEGSGELRGFSKVTRDLSERRVLEERTQELNKELRGRMAQLAESSAQLELRNIELQRLSGQLMRVQDEERRRIARELHDDLGQVLVALKMNLDSSAQSESHGEAIQLAQDALAKVRNLSYVLHPPLLDESGLLPALHVYIEGLKKRTDLKVSLDCKPVPFPRLTRDIENSIFRVVQEALTNVLRHARSPDARLEIHQQTDRIFVRVRDFGVGMPVDAATGVSIIGTGVGLGGMKERVKQLGGQVNFLRAEPGTLVEAVIPLFR
jgi:PAS domain S-box-containing protein